MMFSLREQEINPRKKSGIQLGFEPRTPAHYIVRHSDDRATWTLGRGAEDKLTQATLPRGLGRTPTD